MTFKTLAIEIEKLNFSNAKRTRDVARAKFRRLIAFFGDRELADINELVWNEYVIHCKREAPTRRLTHDRKAMKTVLLFAFRNGLTNRQIKLKIPDKPREVGRELAAGELGQLCDHATERLRFQIQCAVRMGFRKSELLTLRWDRFDWNARLVRLRPEDTKTSRGRHVPIPAVLLPEFQKRFRRRRGPFVFPSKFNPERPQCENKFEWQRCKRLAKVECRWHDLRHTAASIMARRGISEGVVCRILGMSERVLRRIYRHIDVNELHAAASAMSEYQIPNQRKP